MVDLEKLEMSPGIDVFALGGQDGVTESRVSSVE
jgi:hypothetical protein